MRTFVEIKKLNREYKEIYKRTKKQLCIDVQNGKERENALMDFSEMLLTASNNNEPVLKLFPDGYDEFYKDFISVLPVYSIEIKQKKRIFKKLCYCALTIITVVIISFFILLNTGYIGMWTEGISYFAGDLNKYTYTYRIDENSYSLSIDLTNLKNNIGKVLFNKNGCKIIVDDVDYAGISGGGYRIQFMSCGTYNVNNAKLVSGVKHYVTEDLCFSYNMTAKLTTLYKGKKYTGEVMGLGGINNIDGDNFNFYLFPNDAYTSREIPKSNAGNATITVSNLCINTWSKR